MTIFMRIVAPAEWVLSTVTELVMRVLPIAAPAQTPVTDEEINLMMREGAASGTFHETESAIVQMALRLGDRRADTLMTPRTQIEWLDIEDGWAANLAKIKSTHFSRFPVVEGGAETVLGVLKVRDLLDVMAEAPAGAEIDLRQMIRPPLYVPNTVPAPKLLETLRNSGEPFALIVDEYGDLDGVVTLTDIVRSLVGDIVEPGEEPEDRSIIRREDGSWLIDGLTPIDEVKAAIGLDRLPDEESGDFHTLGGFVMAQMKRVPSVADHVVVRDWRFEVVAMDGHRVDKVMVAPPPPEPDDG
jgi:putative hemolysin